MQFTGWMYDIAREQSPSEPLLGEFLNRSATAGYNAVAFYLEHRFAYPSAPWAAGAGCVAPDTVRRLTSDTGRSAPVRVIPFLNTLGHMEGFINAEGGQWLAEGEASFAGEQICATRPECAEFAHNLVADALAAFDDEWVHLGGDETRQLGQCPRCAARVAEIGPGGLYGEYFGALCNWVLQQGRRPCLWGDMLLQHPAALDRIPRATVIFDWQYSHRPRESTQLFRQRGFDVVCCPSLQTYNSAWCYLNDTQRIIDEHAEDARQLGALGVLLTTWEFSWFTQYAGVWPLIYATGRRLAHGQAWPAAIAAEGGSAYAEAAEILGNAIPATSPFIQAGTWRQLRDRFVIRQNPFYLWEAWREDACGPAGDEILRLCDRIAAVAPCNEPLDEALLFGAELYRVAVEWVRLVERAYRHYATGELASAATVLEQGPDLLNRLRPGLQSAAANGGSTADLFRLAGLIEKARRVVARIAALTGSTSSRSSSAAYRPAFQTLVHDAYIPDDQAAWRTRMYR